MDLHPAAATGESWANGVDGGQQAGFAYIGNVMHASLWTGTAASWLDLHPLLPTGFSESGATGIWRDVDFTYVVGYGFNNALAPFSVLDSPRRILTFTNSWTVTRRAIIPSESPLMVSENSRNSE